MSKDKQLESIIRNIDVQIEFHKSQIKSLEFAKQKFLNEPPIPVNFLKHSPKLTKDYVKNFMKNINKPIKTKEAINIIFMGSTDEEKTKAIKTLSVIFNTLEKDGYVKIEKKEGVKGNLYKWIEK